MSLHSIPVSSGYRRVIQIEFNEISDPIVQQLMDEGALPNFARMEREWCSYETIAEDEYKHLEPWIQWPTVHTGKAFADHKLFHLSDAARLEHDQIWETLADAGIESAILGSMNTTRGRATGGIFFPDPWARSNDAYPDALKPLWGVISSRVQTHAVAPPSKADLLKGLLASREYGLPASLYARIAKQLLRQRFDRLSSWRLASLFDEYLTEIFLTLMKGTSFGFNTLFLNSVAHYQHHYWRNFDPKPFADEVRAPDCHPVDDPVRVGYLKYDEILGRVLDARQPSDLVVVLSGLSQRPFVTMEGQGGMNYYRLRDHEGFARSLGLQGEVFPLMSRDWQIKPPAAQREDALALLSGLRVQDEPLFHVVDNDNDTLFLETSFTRGNAADATVVRADGSAVGRFGDLFVNIAVKSGHHDTRGMLWVSEPRAGDRQQVPLTAVRDIPLAALGVEDAAAA
jgi:hypothetical protein